MIKKVISIPLANGHEVFTTHLSFSNSANLNDPIYRKAEAKKLFDLLGDEASSPFFNDLAKLFVDWTMVKKNDKAKVIDTDTEQRFLVFWKEYPISPSRAAALKSFVALKLNQQTFAEVMDGLRLNKLLWERNKTELKYIPHPTTWLNQKRWEGFLEKKVEVKKTEARSSIMNEVLSERGL